MELCLVLMNKTIMNQADVILLGILEDTLGENNCGRMFFSFYFQNETDFSTKTRNKSNFS